MCPLIRAGQMTRVQPATKDSLTILSFACAFLLGAYTLIVMKARGPALATCDRLAIWLRHQAA